MTDDYFAVNRAYWDDRAPAHAAAADYRVEEYVADPSAISGVVRFDLHRLGDVAGVRGVHLQCHIGTDALSLHRLGARMTGLDLSPASLAQARDLWRRAGADIEGVEANTLDAVAALGAGRFDLVYSSIGTLIWLPDITRWAEQVAGLLAPGGRLFIRDSHPMLGAFEVVDGRLDLAYPYFTPAEPLVFEDEVSYVATDRELANLPSAEWSHGIGQILTAVLRAGLEITGYTEHPTVPFQALDGLTVEHPELPGEYWLADRPERLAATFTLQARKP